MSNSIVTTDLVSQPAERERPADHGLSKIKAYYAAVAEDFRAWSPNLNMHFGYWSPRLNPLRREAMLERMNAEVLVRLNLPEAGETLLADLGCGAGATARAIVKARPGTIVDAVTLSQEQVLQGVQLNRAQGTQETIQFRLADYNNSKLPAARYDGVYALESACHASGTDKVTLLREMHRLLKPGGRLLIADAFLRKPGPLPCLVDRVYRQWCEGWAISELGEIGAVLHALAREGFTDIVLEDISFRVAPSVAHVPLFATWFALREWVKSGFQLSAWRSGHILASFASILMGCWLPGFGYYMVSARKGDCKS